MNAFLLIDTLFFIRFILLGQINKEALPCRFFCSVGGQREDGILILSMFKYFYFLIFFFITNKDCTLLSFIALIIYAAGIAFLQFQPLHLPNLGRMD